MPDRATKVYSSYGTAKLCPQAWLRDPGRGLVSGGAVTIRCEVHGVAEGEQERRRRASWLAFRRRRKYDGVVTSSAPSLRGVWRNLKFARKIMPIVVTYFGAKRRAARLRKKTKAHEPERYYAERTKLWDDQHEASAVEIRKFFA